MAGSQHQGLETYRGKRKFQHTPEPARTPRRRASPEAEPGERHFVIHLHHARRRHFDLRLQVGGSLRSWAVPKGPSRDPSIKHLAVEVEDHPLSYASFEGSIPEGHYGAGTVAIWDEGTWSTDDSATKQLEKGHLRFELHGTRLHGRWSLVRTSGKSSDKPQWLLIKGEDQYTDRGDVADDTPLSQWKLQHLREETAQSGSRKTTRSVRRPKRGAETSKLSPQDFGFQLARLYQRAPSGADWLHEVKYDGYRMLAWCNGDDLQLLSRNHLDWTDRMPRIVEAIRALKCRSCALDGELVVFDSEGHTRFDLLQQEFTRAHADAAHYVVFDLLTLDGKDLRDQPLHQRKAALSRLLESADDVLMLSGFIQGEGSLAHARACEAGLEGIISKAVDAPYAAGRTDAWRKLKCVDSDEFVIVGYTAGKGSRGVLGALLLAEPRGNGWHYVGRVGTGMDEAMLKRVHDLLKPTRTAPSLVNPPDAKQLRGGKVTWVEPDHVVEIAFRGRTGDDMLRQGSFKGLRPDKSPADLRDSDRGSNAAETVEEMPVPDIALTHPERVLIEKPRVTKQKLAEFYASIADRLLPGILGRPLSLVRCPDGIGSACFFQKHGMRGMPESIRVGRQRNSKGEDEEFLYVDGIEGVLGLVQMNVIEIHPWGSTIADLEHPDRLIFDLDPDPGVSWPRVKEGARLLRERLQAVNLESFLRTTGGKGLHVVVPLNPRPDWETAKAFSQALARTLEAEAPREYVSVASKARRKGRIFVDYLRNARGSTAVASYCVRAREGAGVATPLRWEELSKLRSGAQYTISNLPRRLKTLQSDPWQGIEEVRQALPG